MARARCTARRRSAALAAGAGLAAAVAALLALAGGPGSAQVGAARVAPPVVLTVTATDTRLVLSRATVAAGVPVAVTFVNRGKAAHALALGGKRTAAVQPGGSARLTVTFARKGPAVAQCALPGHAAREAKAILQVTAAAAPDPAAPAATTPAATTASAAPSAPAAAPATTAPATTAPATTAPAPPVASNGDPVAGRAVWIANGCGSCHTMAAAGSTGSSASNLDAVKPSQDTIVQYTAAGATEGAEVMPAYPLNATDMANLAAFVYQATHAGS